MGEVHEGTTVTDWMEQERERGITITAAAISCAWNASVRPVEGDQAPHQHHRHAGTRGLHGRGRTFAARPRRRGRRILTRLAGVQPQSETVWRQANKYRVPRLAFINKMDRVGANFHACVDEIRKKLKAPTPIALFLPIGAEENFSGLVDLVQMKAYFFEEDPADPLGLDPGDRRRSRPECWPRRRNTARSLIEAVADCDDEIAHKYLEGVEIGVNELMLGIRKATVSLKFCGVIPGSAFKKKGVQRLLDCVVNYLPSPIDLPPMKGQTSDGQEVPHDGR